MNRESFPLYMFLWSRQTLQYIRHVSSSYLSQPYLFSHECWKARIRFTCSYSLLTSGLPWAFLLAEGRGFVVTAGEDGSFLTEVRLTLGGASGFFLKKLNIDNWFLFCMMKDNYLQWLTDDISFLIYSSHMAKNEECWHSKQQIASYVSHLLPSHRTSSGLGQFRVDSPGENPDIPGQAKCR